jgi:ABC-type Fe3+/spermidine/putrescine transport system ATPase subunit
MSARVLTVEHLTMRFGGLLAVSDLSFIAQAREITALIGPNGAGKTTLFNCITGFYKPTVGMLQLAHPDGAAFLLERIPEFRIAREARVARTFQNVRLFAGMTLLENLLVAQHNALMVASGFTVLGLSAPTIPPARFPMARSAGSRSCARCAPIRCCCASTSRPPASTAAKAPSSTRSCRRSATSTASRSS